MSHSATKIAILKSGLTHRGGIEKQTRNLSQAFTHAGCTVTILTSGDTGNEVVTDSYRTVTVAPKSKISLRHLLCYNRACDEWLVENPTDIVFGMDRNPCQTHYRAGNGVHRAYLHRRAMTDGWLKRASFAVNPLHRTILNLERRCFECPTLETLFVNSQMVADEVKEHYPDAAGKTVVVHNAVEWSAMEGDFDSALQKKPLLCQERGLDPDRVQLVFVGQGYRRKGLDFLLRGLANVPVKNVELSVIGKDRELKRYRQLTRKLGLERRVHFFGPRDDTRTFYQLADALIIPSTYDPFANVTVEALAMGVYVISSKYNGGSEVLESGTGTVIEQLDDPSSVADAILAAAKHRKNEESARHIRHSVEHLDLNRQFKTIVQQTLESLK